MPRELKDVNVEFISLVNKGANKNEIAIYKSADYVPPEKQASATGVVKSDNSEDLLHKIIKSVTAVLKGDQKRTFDERMQAAIANSNIWRAVDVLQSMIYDILYAWPGDEYETDTPMADIGKLIDDFKAFYLANLSALGFTKAAQQMKESIDARKAAEAGTSFQKNAGLTQAHVDQIQKCSDTLGEVLKLAKASNTSIEKEDTEMNAEVLKQVLEPLTKSIQDLTTKVENLEKNSVKPEDVAKAQETAAQASEAASQAAETAQQAVEKAAETAQQTTTEVAKTAEQLIADAFKQVGDSIGAIAKSVEGLGERIAKMEESPVVPNAGGDGSTTVTKSASTFGNTFTFPGEK